MRIYTEEKTDKRKPQSGQQQNVAFAKSPVSPSSSTCSSVSSMSSVTSNGIACHSSVSSPDSSSTVSSSSSTTYSDVHNGSHINRVNIPFVFNKNRANISMYKFINTKGKQAHKDNHNAIGIIGGIQNNGNGFRGGGPNPHIVHHNHHHHHLNHHNANVHQPYFDNTISDYCKPPRYVTSNHNFYKKRISAIDKIQEELREMKLREDELRCQRVRGLSYPNLNSICDEDFNSDDQTIESSEENKDSFHSRCSSNPDLLNGGGGRHSDSLYVIDINNTVNMTTTSPTSEESSSTSSEDYGIKIGGPRRKIPLIAIWEQKIQEENNSDDNSKTSTNKTNGTT